MNDANILERLTPLFRDVFDNDDIVAMPELVFRQLAGWDSLANVRLFLEIEDEFGVSIGGPEIASLKTIGEIVSLLQRKLGTRS